MYFNVVLQNISYIIYTSWCCPRWWQQLLFLRNGVGCQDSRHTTLQYLKVNMNESIFNIWTYPYWCVCVQCAVQNVTVLGDTQQVTCYVSKLIQGVYLVDLLFCNQCVMLVKCLHIKCVSKQFIFVPLLHGFSNFSVCSAGSYSCFLFNMSSAYAEVGLLVLIQRMCSLCLMVIDLTDFPITIS